MLFIDPTAQAATLGFPTLSGGDLVYKQVQSIRKRRFADLVEQKTDFSCGAAALTTIPEKAHGAPLDRQAVVQDTFAHADPKIVRTQGFSMFDVKRYAESMGMRARGYRIETAQLEQLKIPAIVLMEIRGHKHPVVLQYTQSEHVYVGDPVLGHERYALTEFAKDWNGIVSAVIGQEYDHGSPLLMPSEPPTTHNRLGRFKPIRDAELTEFGFTQNNFF